MKKRKMLTFIILFLCCIGGCGKSERNKENANNMEEMQEQEEAGDSDMVRTPGDETDCESETGLSGSEAVFFENGKPVEGIIPEQSFKVELDGWETVTFVSAAPENHKGAPYFLLEKDGTVVYTFPENRYPKTDDFVEVSAVSFTDYNGDGKKDVIVLIRYHNGSDAWNEAQIFLQENSDNMFYMDYPDLESQRLDAPTDKGTAFYRDGLLEEYLLTQKLTDTVSSIEGTWADYIEYVDGLHGYISSDRQLTLLAENRDIWAVPVDYADERYCFTVTDLDYDGCLEVITANQGGTGHYTYSRFYEMGADGKLKELETSFMEGDSQPDIMEEQMTVYSSFSAEGMRDYYIMYDEIRTAPDCYVYRLTSLCMMGDYITEIPLATQTVTYEGENYIAHTVSEDYNGNPLTEEEFWNFPDVYYSSLGLSKKTASLHWMDMNELAGKSDGEAAELLRQAYEGFQR